MKINKIKKGKGKTFFLFHLKFVKMTFLQFWPQATELIRKYLTSIQKFEKIIGMDSST